MARQLDTLIIVDLEATCWQGDPPDGMSNEIIEIGVCTYDLGAGARVDKRSILVTPRDSSVSAFCTQLTTLTQEQVDGGVDLSEACRVLKKEYQSKQRLWASWGDYDRRQLERECRSKGIGYPFGPTHLNLKTLFALSFGLDHEVGMDHALDHCGLELEGTHHRGDDDAWNIGAIFDHLRGHFPGFRH